MSGRFHFAPRLRPRQTNMKTVVGAILGIVCATSTIARPVRVWTHEDLLKEADVVAIVRIDRVVETSATLEGHGDAKQYQGKRAAAVVGLSLKGALSRTFTFDFFTYSSPTTTPPNGAMFPDLSRRDKVHYLVFLKKTTDGTLLPVAGHYDGDVSIRPIESN